MTTVDLLIRRGTVVDGTGRERRIADIAIADGRVIEVGELGAVDAETVIDAENLIVAPGFIDTHTHYDAQVFWDPYCTASGWHGVTTVQMSNCGFGLAPLPKELRTRGLQMMTRTEQIAMRSMEVGVPYDWETYPQFLDSLRRTPKGVNVASYFPLNPAIFWVMGADAAKGRALNEAEVRQLQVLFAEALDAGALGLAYSSCGGKNNHTDFDGSQLPIEFVSEDVICALGEVLRNKGKGIIQILLQRGETPDAEMDRLFTERLAAVAQRPVVYNAITVTNDPVGGRADRQMAWLDKCEQAGLPVWGQGALSRFWIEYSLESFNFFDVVPAWARAATKKTLEETVAYFSDSATREEMKRPENFDNVDWSLALFGPQSSKIIDVKGLDHLEKYEGRLVGDIAKEEGRHPVDVFLDVACETKLAAVFLCMMPGGWEVAPVSAIARHPRVLYGLSDAGAHTQTFNGAAWTTEVLTRLVRDEGVVPLEEAHHKLSALPAEIAGYADRGTIEPGKAADIIVYDLENLAAVPHLAYETVCDQPGDEWRKVQRAVGYRYTIVNGQITLVDGQPTGNLSGLVLSPAG